MKRPLALGALVLAMILAVVTFTGSTSQDSRLITTSAPVTSTTTTTTPEFPTPEIRLQNVVDKINLDKWNQAVWLHKSAENEARLAAEAEAARLEEERREAERQEKIEAEKAEAAEAPAPSSGSKQAPEAPASSGAPAPAASSGSCGGDLPPCYVLNRESGGDARIWNGGCYAPVGHLGSSPCGSSSASGLWQFVRGTWGGYGGYVNAADAPPSVQNAKARELWAGGAGCGHWGACG